MTNAVNTHNRPQNTAVPTDTRPNASTAEKQSSSARVSSGGDSNPSAIVELSSSGLLQNIGDQIDKLPEVNEAKVASIKQSLAQGEYKPDVEVIARKFSEIENLLP